MLTKVDLSYCHLTVRCSSKRYLKCWQERDSPECSLLFWLIGNIVVSEWREKEGLINGQVPPWIVVLLEPMIHLFDPDYQNDVSFVNILGSRTPQYRNGNSQYTTLVCCHITYGLYAPSSFPLCCMSVNTPVICRLWLQGGETSRGNPPHEFCSHVNSLLQPTRSNSLSLCKLRLKRFARWFVFYHKCFFCFRQGNRPDYGRSLTWACVFLIWLVSRIRPSEISEGAWPSRYLSYYSFNVACNRHANETLHMLRIT